jgi:1,4-alpha-glucan branching enzyme
LMYTYMWTHPGAKLLFMGDEFGQTSEWNYKSELEWNLLEYEPHKKLKNCVAGLNHLLCNEPALYENQFNIYGFEWVDLNHRAEMVVSYRRKGKKEEDDLLVILNLTAVVRNDWAIYVNDKQFTKEIFNSDNRNYWGTGDVFNPDIRSELVNEEQKLYKLTLNLPPLGGIVLK